MQRESRKLLLDMRKAAMRVQQKTEDYSEAAFLADQDLNDLVNWNLLVIGEAMSALAKLDLATAQQIPPYRQIIGLRNQLAHGYSAIRRDVTWRIATLHVPALLAQLDALLIEPE